MKRCNACDSEFEESFSFCPVDATPLGSQQIQPSSHMNQLEFHLTMIDSAGLLQRLASETQDLVSGLRSVWPEVKRDPLGFARGALVEGSNNLRRALVAPNALTALATSLLLVLSSVLLLLTLGNLRGEGEGNVVNDGNVEIVELVEFTPDVTVSQEDKGLGAGSKDGRVGFAGDKGEGSGAKPKKSSGGGSGGDRDPLPAQVGKLPQPSEIPAPIPKLPPAQNRSLPVAGIDVDPLLWKNLAMATYGDPRSTSVAPSSGPGDGGGMGTVTGTGIGEGKGPGFGPGQDGNIGGGQKEIGCCGPGGSSGRNPLDPDRIYPAPQVSERARVIVKPEPQYTEEARRNAVTGTVVLRVVFARTGEVTNIRAVQSLPFGLTERAIAAARQIRFRPATKDGQPVNVSMQLEYNFNLY